MSLPRIVLALLVSAMLSGAGSLARAQSASPKAPTSAAKPPAAKPEASKPDASKPDASKPQAAKPDTSKPAAAVAGGAEPTLIGQYGTWGAYTATPNGKKVCFALAKPASSKANPPNRPRDPAYAFVSTRPAE